ncbi:hypothetical protein [Streptomyces broussonetiae]|uniref:Uncharacterized protein n=1 Tax=Streptomyces broussonetiae TaxID=2686304 RepID=A0A6I6N2J3_9ACTN|nr:hypothetical protein [Streptomyces broussonetiae]QHA03085.1 hypothetical protein GQF42_07165 [Streptomyces broussonetiae]
MGGGAQVVPGALDHLSSAGAHGRTGGRARTACLDRTAHRAARFEPARARRRR